MNPQRFGIIIFFFLLFFVLLEIRIVSLTLFPDPRLKLKDNSSVARGVILDRKNRELSVNSVRQSLYIRPAQLDSPTLNSIHQALLQSGFFSTQDLSSIFQKKNFVWIQRKISPECEDAIKPWLETIKSNKIIRKDEIGLTPEACRTYPDRESSQIVGYVGLDNTGLSGLEYGLDAYLQKGYTVRTTLDVQLCRIAYQELEKSVREHQAESGSAAIIDLENNEILSLVSFPNGLLAQNQGVSPETLRFPAASMARTRSVTDG